MQKVIRIKLLKDPGGAGGFCMSVGSIIELYDGRFRSPEVNASYYPVFGPYEQMQTVARSIQFGYATEQTKELFEISDVTNVVSPTLQHNIMDEAGGKIVCTASHQHLMKLLSTQMVDKKRGTETEIFKLSNQVFHDIVLKYTSMDLGKSRFLKENYEWLAANNLYV